MISRLPTWRGVLYWLSVAGLLEQVPRRWRPRVGSLLASFDFTVDAWSRLTLRVHVKGINQMKGVNDKRHIYSDTREK